MATPTAQRTEGSGDDPDGGPSLRRFNRRRFFTWGAAAMGGGAVGWAAWKHAPRLEVESVTPQQSETLPPIAALRLVNDTPHTFELAAFLRSPNVCGGPTLQGLVLVDAMVIGMHDPEPYLPILRARLPPGGSRGFLVSLQGTGPQCVGVWTYWTCTHPSAVLRRIGFRPTRTGEDPPTGNDPPRFDEPDEVQYPALSWSPPIFPDGVVRPTPSTSTLDAGLTPFQRAVREAMRPS